MSSPFSGEFRSERELPATNELGAGGRGHWLRGEDCKAGRRRVIRASWTCGGTGRSGGRRATGSGAGGGRGFGE
eukprot:g7225.t1